MELRHPRAPALRGVVAGAARVALLAGPTAIGFADGGYFQDARLIGAIAAWTLVAVLAIVVEGPADGPEAAATAGRRRLVLGGTLVPRTAAARLALGGLLALTAWVLVTRAWAPLPGPAGEDVQRDALYLGALVAGALAWRGRRWACSVEALLAAGTLIVIGYGLVGRLAPGVLTLTASVYAGGRLDQPLTYWNATGALAAIGVVLCARLAGDRARPAALRTAAAAAGPPLALGLYLTYSRGALGAVAGGLLVLLLLAPTWAQLRAAVLVVGGGAVVCAVASRFDGVASLAGTPGHRERQGAVVLAILVVAMLAVAAAQAWACRSERLGHRRAGPLPLPRWVRPAGWAAAIALALVPYAAAVVGERGSAQNPTFGASAQRLGSVGSNRYAYWRVAFRTFLEHPVKGTGAASFRVDWLRERPFRESVLDAHSLYFETLAELGLVGFVLLCALLAGVLLALRRALDADPALAIGPAAALTVWAIHAGVDWDWEMPGLTLVAVTLAGMLLAQAESGRGEDRAAARPPRPAPPPRGRPATARPRSGSASRRRWRSRRAAP